MTHNEIETAIDLLSAERDRVNELRRALDVAIYPAQEALHCKMYFEYWKGRDDKWYWHLKSANHKVIADGGGGYVSKESVQRAIATFKNSVVSAPSFDSTPSRTH